MGGSLSLHGWALNMCNFGTSVSCGPESCFLFVASQLLQLWEKNKKSFPLEKIVGKEVAKMGGVALGVLWTLLQPSLACLLCIYAL